MSPKVASRQLLRDHNAGFRNLEGVLQTRPPARLKSNLAISTSGIDFQADYSAVCSKPQSKTFRTGGMSGLSAFSFTSSDEDLAAGGHAFSRT
jgi:hypothetical protein